MFLVCSLTGANIPTHVIHIKSQWKPCSAKQLFFLFQLRYQKCLVARPPSQRAGCSSAPSPDSVTRRVTTSVKRGVQSLIDTLKTKKQPSELPQQWCHPRQRAPSVRPKMPPTTPSTPQHVISASHGYRGCTYMLNTAAAEKAEDSSTRPGNAKMIEKKKKKHICCQVRIEKLATLRTFYSRD